MKKVIKFEASWCNPCKQLGMRLAKVETDIPFEVVDIETNRELAIEYGVKSIPTLVMLDGNVEIKRFSGIKTVDQLKDWLTS